MNNHPLLWNKCKGIENISSNVKAESFIVVDSLLRSNFPQNFHGASKSKTSNIYLLSFMNLLEE